MGVTVNVDFARSAFCKVVSCKRPGGVVSQYRGPSLFFSRTRAVPTKSEAMRHRLHAVKIYALVVVVSVAAASLLVFRGWEVPAPYPSKFLECACRLRNPWDRLRLLLISSPVR